MPVTAELERALRQADDEINAAYWRFTRCARGSPPPGDLYERRNAIRDQLMAARRSDALRQP